MNNKGLKDRDNEVLSGKVHTPTPWTTKTNKILGLERLILAVTTFGHKPLLKYYECPMGDCMLITKSAGRLHFFFDEENADIAKKLVDYYLNRYGINTIETFIHVI